jgi:WD40 repeat protein
LSADGKTLAVADGGVLLLDAATGKETGRLAKQKQSIYALAFSPDGKSLAVGLEKSVEVWPVAGLGRIRKSRPARDPVPPLEAKVASRKGTYTVALGGKTAEDFARRFDLEKPLPASPTVDLMLTLRNTSDKRLTLDPDGRIESYLVGTGALNHPMLPYQTGIGTGIGPGASFPEPKKVALAPGESYSIPIRSLDNGHGRQSYWLLPGEYNLHVSYDARVAPAPDGGDKGAEGWGYVTLHAAPLRLTVVADPK